MPDMLVKLYELPQLEPILAQLAKTATTVRRAKAPERRIVVDWVTREFSPRWGDQCNQTFDIIPPRTFIALDDNAIIGFASYDAVFLGVFGPMGVMESFRRKGVGGALLMVCLEAMRDEGYVYGIIGRVGPTEFYSRLSKATIIPDSDPGMHTDLLR